MKLANKKKNMNKRTRYTKKRWPWQTKQASGLQSPSTIKSFGQTLQEEFPSNNTYHRSCQTLPYGKFMDAIVSNNPVFLVIKGHPTESELIEAWDAILQEYVDLIKTKKSESIFQAWKQVAYTEWKISFMEICLEQLKEKYDKDIAEGITLLGYSLIQPNEDRQLYLKQIYAVETEAKTLIVLLNQYHNEYILLCPNGDKQSTRTIADYDKELMVLSKFMGFKIDKHRETTAEVCAIINSYLEYNQNG